MASDFDDVVKKAFADEQIIGGAAIAVTAENKRIISRSFGKTYLDEDARPFQLDSTMWVASCTKLLTAICVLQCVEKGLLNLDAPVGRFLEEWKQPNIMTGFDEHGTPILKPAKNALTLRRMLTHSSGMGYSGLNPLIDQYRAFKGQIDTNSNISADSFYPLLFEPGEGWEYGIGIDYAGKVIEKVTAMALGQHMAENIWKPLSMTSTTFRPLDNESVMDRMVGRVIRDISGKLRKDESESYRPRTREDDFGGSGLYTSTEDYIKVLVSLLKNDGKLLGNEMQAELFRGQLENPGYFTDIVHQSWYGHGLVPGYPRDQSTIWDHALGGAYVAGDIDGQAREGTIFWSGVPNSYWFIDRRTGVCGFYGGWLLPPGDLPTGQVLGAFQRAAEDKEELKTKPDKHSARQTAEKFDRDSTGYCVLDSAKHSRVRITKSDA